MKLGWIIAASSLLLAGQPAFAQSAPPKIGGPYLLNYVVTCQTIVTTTKSGSDLTGISFNSPGGITHNTGIAGFNASNGTVVINGFSDTGGLVKYVTGNQGTAVAESPWTRNLTFSVTPTTITFSTSYGSQVYNLIYTPTGSTREVTAFMFNGVISDPNTPGCTAIGTAIQQTSAP